MRVLRPDKRHITLMCGIDLSDLAGLRLRVAFWTSYISDRAAVGTYKNLHYNPPSSSVRYISSFFIRVKPYTIITALCAI